jgi:hypothetical protein
MAVAKVQNSKDRPRRVFRKSGYRFCDQNTRHLKSERFLTANRLPLCRKKLREVDFLQMPIRRRLLAILLDAGGSQAGKAVLVDGKLPRQEFVAAAGFLEGKQAAANRGNDFGLATDNPSLGSGCGQIRDRQRTAVGPDDVFYPRAMGFCHGVLTNSQPLN